MAKEIENTVLNIAEPIAKQFDLYIVDVEFKKEGNDWYLRIFIDKENGVGIDDCENVSRAFSDAIDKLDPIEQNYCLEVSSPGADRKLKKEREFLYYIGREVEVKLYKAMDTVKEFTGVLKGYEDKKAYIEIGEKIVEIEQSQAVYIRLAFKF